MPTININMLVSQSKYYKNNEQLSESEAIQKAISAAMIDEEAATTLDLENEISKAMNITHDQQRAEAEAQLQAQANGYQPGITKEELEAAAPPPSNEPEGETPPE